MTAPLAPLVMAVLAGLIAGALHFASLAPIARMLAEGRLIAVPLQSLRLILLAAILWLMAREGAWVLLSGALGVLLGRAIVLRRERARA